MAPQVSANNYSPPQENSADWANNHTGKHQRIFDTPHTPADSLLRVDRLASSQRETITATRPRSSLADVARNAARIHQEFGALPNCPTWSSSSQHWDPHPPRRESCETQLIPPNAYLTCGTATPKTEFPYNICRRLLYGFMDWLVASMSYCFRGARWFRATRGAD